MLAVLYAKHMAEQKEAGIVVKADGLMEVGNVKEHGILDTLLSKVWSIKFATYTVNTILSIDQVRLICLCIFVL